MAADEAGDKGVEEKNSKLRVELLEAAGFGPVVDDDGQQHESTTL